MNLYFRSMTSGIHIISHATFPCGVAISVRSHPALDEVLSPKTCKTKKVKNQNTVKHLFMQTTRDDENSSSIAIPIAYSLCPSNFHFFGGSPLPSRYPVLRRQSHPMLPHGLPWGKNGGTLSDVSSRYGTFFIWSIPCLRRLVYTYQFVRLFTFLYQDQQEVPRHRGKLRCTLAARRASLLQSVPNKSCEWNAGIPIKLTAKGTENQWVGKWICVRGPADPQRLCWLPSSLKHTHIYI